MDRILNSAACNSFCVLAMLMKNHVSSIINSHGYIVTFSHIFNKPGHQNFTQITLYSSFPEFSAQVSTLSWKWVKSDENSSGFFFILYLFMQLNSCLHLWLNAFIKKISSMTSVVVKKKNKLFPRFLFYCWHFRISKVEEEEEEVGWINHRAIWR